MSYPQCVTQMKDFGKDALDEACVLAQNRAFYAALRDRNVELMGQVWSQSAQVSCIHPGWQPLHGRETVMASWETILQHSNLPAIYPQAASVHLWGDTALVICEESFREGRLVATNIFVREADDWRLLHHQAGPLNPSADIDDVDSLFDDGDPDALLGLHDDDPAAGGRVSGGIVAATRFQDLRKVGLRLIGMGILLPILHGALGVSLGHWAGLSLGWGTLGSPEGAVFRDWRNCEAVGPCR